MRIGCSEFRANIGRCLDAAVTEPVIITNAGRDEAALISAAVFAVLRRRPRAALHPALKQRLTISAHDFHRAYPHCKKTVESTTFIIAKFLREKAVYLSPSAFDSLFEGSLPDDARAAVAAAPQKVTAMMFQLETGSCLRRALRRPLIVTFHGRDKGVLLSMDLYRVLRRHAAGPGLLPDPITVTSSDIGLACGRHLDLALIRPVIITSKGEERHVLLSADAFRRLNETAQPFGRASPQAVSLEALRGRYTYADALRAPLATAGNARLARTNKTPSG